LKPKTPQIRYIISVLSIVLVTEIRLALRPVLLTQHPYAILYIAVAVSAYLGGVGPGVLSTVLGCLAALYFFVSPDIFFGPKGLADWIGMGMFLFCSASLIWILERQREEQERAQSAADIAERRLQELLKEMGDRKRAEMAESRANALLDTLFETAPVGLGFLDPDLRFVRVNRTLAALNRLPVTEHIGRAWLDVWPQIPGEMEAALLSVIDTGKPIVNLEIEGFADAEKRVPLNWNVSCYPIQLGSETAGVGAVCEEVTERKRREEALRQSQKMESLGILAGGVAHDFNNILTAILGHASLLSLKLTPGTAESRSARQIVQSSQRAAELTQQMLAYSGRGRFAHAQIDLASEILATRGMLEAALPRNTVLELDLPEDLALVEADPAQIHQLMTNLVTNAAEAMDSADGYQHRVSVSLRLESVMVAPPGRAPTTTHLDPGQYCVLCVHDEGTGMDEATKARIFDPFFSTKFTGRGLGLSAVLGIVRAHRGAIHVESEPGRGSSFRVYFPIAAYARPALIAAPVESAAVPRVAADAPTVLVVDDEIGVLEVTKMVFEAHGFRVLSAGNSEEAIRLFRSEKEIGIVLLDMTMPEVSGDETLRRLRLIRESVLVVGSSGLSEGEARDSFGAGLGGFLQKPYTPRVLMEAIESALALSTRSNSA
jgi:signal transduction histidine kinase/ActR/RegA family two-component response regulator